MYIYRNTDELGKGKGGERVRKGKVGKGGIR